MKINNKSGFTLLEIIIVIIIVGVLASLALPRFFSTVEYSKSTEALAAFSAIRGSLDRCYLQSGDYTNCGTFGDLDIDDPAGAPGAHFGYTISVAANAYTVLATRNTTDSGNTNDWVQIQQTTAGITRSGGNAYSGIH